MGVAGKRYVTDNFAWDKVEDRFIGLVREMNPSARTPRAPQHTVPT